MFVYNAIGQLVAEYSTQTSQTPQISYLTTDHLGSPRLVTDQLGAVKERKDFGAFGDETATAARVSGLGYNADDPTRKGYTGYEKDGESGLEFAQARYYSTTHGRYTSVDPLTASASIRNPQTFNRYTYVLNSPYKYTDPLGLIPVTTGACGQFCRGSGPQVDGSAFRGRDTSFDWMREYFGSVEGYSLNQPDGSTVVEDLNSNFAYIFASGSQNQTQSRQFVQFTRVSLLDDDGNVIKSLKNCGASRGSGSTTTYDIVTRIWEFDVNTVIGPDTNRETFTIKIEFKVIETKGFQGFANEGHGTSVYVPTGGRFELSSLAGKKPVNFEFNGSEGSVNISLRAPREKMENSNMSIRVDIRANYSYLDLFKAESGFRRSDPQRDWFRLKLVWSKRDGHKPRRPID